MHIKLIGDPSPIFIYTDEAIHKAPARPTAPVTQRINVRACITIFELVCYAFSTIPES
jgi:hypothetical protein